MANASAPAAPERRPNSPRMQRLVRAFSALIRFVPSDNGLFRKFVVLGSDVFAPYTFDFSFYCPRIGLRWSAVGYPERLTKHLLFEGQYQLDVIRWIQRLARKGDVVFDVGAHHGLMSVTAARAVGPTGTVVAFEPHPRSRELLAMHARLNGLRNVRIEPLGMWDEPKTLEFYQQPTENSWNSSFIREFVDPGRTVEPILVPCTTIDEYVGKHGLVPRLIKIDTEGTEFRVLRGALETIRAHRPSLVLELNPRSAEAAGTTVAALVSELSQLGYSFWAFPLKRYGGYRFTPTPYTSEMRGADGDLVNVACIAETQRSG
jgi:FkbM family methyltransferase